MEPTNSAARPPWKKRSKEAATTTTTTTFQALSPDILCIIFSFVDLFDLVRLSAVRKSWNSVIRASKLVQILCCKQQKSNLRSPSDLSNWSERSLKMHLEELAMDRHQFCLQEGTSAIYQWENLDRKGKRVGVDQCRMNMGLVLTGGGTKAMRLWSVGSYKCLDEFSLPDRAPLVDFDFDESKVVGLVGTRICIWRRDVRRQVFSSSEGRFMKGSCMRYLDPNAVVGCEDGRARVFDMYLKKWSQIIKIHDGPVTCLSLTEDQMIIGGSSVGSITVSCPSANERVATLRSYGSAGISTLCFNPSSHLLFAGSFAGHASCWDLRRTRKPVWETRVSPNVIHSIHHLRNDTRTLVMGGIDGVLRVADQQTGEVVSRYIIEGRSSSSSVPGGSRRLVERKEARRIAEDTRLDLMPRTSRPSINCVAVGMQKVVTTHPDNYVRVWKFEK